MMLIGIRMVSKNVKQNNFFEEPKKYILELEGNPSVILFVIMFFIIFSVLSFFTAWGN
jgi:hypothetical protein